MKQLLGLLFLSCLFCACGGPEGQQVTSGAALEDEAGVPQMEASAEYLVDPTASKVYWEGTKVVGGGHTGEMPVEFGQMVVASDGNRLVAGQFVLDLRKMTNTDLPEDKAGKLLGHLKSEDFFHVEKYPLVNFDLIRIEAKAGEGFTHEITGNLEMKGVERSITIPAKVTFADGQMRAVTPQFTIDRNEWGVTYGNSTLESVQDNIISDEIGLKLELVANKS